MIKLRQQHHEGHCWAGVDISNKKSGLKDGNKTRGTLNAFESFIWEPMLIRKNALIAAVEAACTILSIDETVKNPKAEQDQIKR